MKPPDEFTHNPAVWHLPAGLFVCFVTLTRTVLPLFIHSPARLTNAALSVTGEANFEWLVFKQ